MDWLEVAKLGVAALTPIMTGIVGFIVLRMGAQVDATKYLNQELLKKRLDLFEDVAPKLNDIFCFYQAVGHWAELNPEEIIRRKRAIDRAIQINRYLFRKAFWEAYQRFEKSHFDMFTAVGKPARLRLDVKHVRERIGDLFKDEWMAFVSSNGGDHSEQARDYQSLMHILGAEVSGAK